MVVGCRSFETFSAEADKMDDCGNRQVVHDGKSWLSSKTKTSDFWLLFLCRSPVYTKIPGRALCVSTYLLYPEIGSYDSPSRDRAADILDGV